MEFSLSVSARNVHGRSAARRMRRAGQVPGVVYGLAEPQSVVIDGPALDVNLRQEAFHSSLIKLEIDGKQHDVLLRETQVNPVNNAVLHVDFQAVASDKLIAATVPLHFVNVDTCPGVKLRHGIFSAIVSEVHVHCLPRSLPEHIEVDIGSMDIGNTLHLSDVPQKEGVTFDQLQRSEDPAVASIMAPRIEEEVDKPAEAETEDTESAPEAGSDSEPPQPQS